MLKRIAAYSLKSRWHYFVALFGCSVALESVLLFIHPPLFVGFAIGSLLTSAGFALTEKRN